MMLKLTEEVRSFAKKPFGKLYRGLREAVRNGEFLVCVGDVVTFTALKEGFNPKIVVFDGKTVRKEVEFVEEIRRLSKDYVEITAENPASCITEDLTEKIFKAVELSLKGYRVRVFVKGEEDLAVMPLVALLPVGTVVLYGQPNEGVVRVDVSEERKVIILDMLGRMESRGRTLEKIRRWSNGGSG